MSRIDTHSSLEAYFEGLLRDALSAEQVDLPEDAFSYVLHLVGDFSRPEHLHGRGGHDEPGTPGLVWLYKEAREAAPSARFDAYRHLGDVALMVSSFFGPHVERERSLVGVEYYVDMGRTAYGAAASLALRSGFAALLGGLSQRFDRLVEVLTRVAEQTTLPVAADIGALYARICRNPNSPELSRRLLSSGAFPVFGGKGVAA